MTKVRKAFNILPNGTTAPDSYQKIPCHMIFDVKMEDFKHKAQLVAGGHKTEAPATITYASVVSRETVRIALMLAALNDLQVKAGGILNAYITAPVKEKVWTILRPEFGNDAGKGAIIVHALYGLKSTGAVFRAHLASFMHQMGYTSCKADPDLWYKAETHPDDSVLYYAYILCYVDNKLCIHHDTLSVLTQINKYLPLKPTSVGDPDIYLCAKLKETQLPNGIYAWGMSPSKYVNQAVKNCQTYLSAKLNKADPDLWFKAETHPDDTVLYYAYILCYVDDILCINHDALSVLTQINDYLPLKPTSVGDPDIYLGAKLKETNFPMVSTLGGRAPQNMLTKQLRTVRLT
jgi:hypothetical protein